MLLAPFLFLIRVPARDLGKKLVAPATAFSACLGIYMADSLFNSFYNPVLMVASGGLTSLLLTPALRQVDGEADSVQEEPAALVPATRVI